MSLFFSTFLAGATQDLVDRNVRTSPRLRAFRAGETAVKPPGVASSGTAEVPSPVVLGDDRQTPTLGTDALGSRDRRAPGGALPLAPADRADDDEVRIQIGCFLDRAAALRDRPADAGEIAVEELPGDDEALAGEGDSRLRDVERQACSAPSHVLGALHRTDDPPEHLLEVASLALPEDTVAKRRTDAIDEIDVPGGSIVLNPGFIT